MSIKNYKPEQIVTILRQIEVQMANGEDGTAGLQGSGDTHADLLPLAEGIRRVEAGASETAEGVGEGKHPIETTGSGGKLLSPEQRRCEACQVRCASLFG